MYTFNQVIKAVVKEKKKEKLFISLLSPGTDM